MTRKRYSTPPSVNYSEILSTIVSLVRKLKAFVNQHCSIEIGTPGTISSIDGMPHNSNTTFLNRQPISSDLELELGRPIRIEIENDANCFILFEAIDGDGCDNKTVFSVILGTGVGGGIVHRQKLLKRRLQISREWSHNELEIDGGPLYYCGQYGCVETSVGTRVGS